MKFKHYAAHGVREYWLLDPDTRTVEKFFLISWVAVIAGFKTPANAFFDDRANQHALRPPESIRD